ncbi:hypothetical protein TNCV_678381 [Trichonephila clavipes]|nr:hypothetical protein TNCV_678381 [Trichonephila clavipes]
MMEPLYLEAPVSLIRSVPVYPLGAWGEHPGVRSPEGARGPEKLDLTRLSGYRFRSASAKGARRSSAQRVRNELKPALNTVDTSS